MNAINNRNNNTTIPYLISAATVMHNMQKSEIHTNIHIWKQIRDAGDMICDHNTPYSNRLTSHQYFKKVRCEEQIVHTMPARNLRNKNSYLSLHNYTYQLQRWSINDTVAMQNSQTSKESMDESGLNVTIFLTHAALWSGINGRRCSNQGKTRHAWKTKRALLSLVLLTYLGQGRYF